MPLFVKDNLGQVLRVGDRIVCLRDNSEGTVRFVGKTSFKDGLWVGIELDKPVGKNDGSRDGRVYFTAQPNYGRFARPSTVEKVAERTPTKQTPGQRTLLQSHSQLLTPRSVAAASAAGSPSRGVSGDNTTVITTLSHGSVTPHRNLSVYSHLSTASPVNMSAEHSPFLTPDGMLLVQGLTPIRLNRRGGTGGQSQQSFRDVPVGSRVIDNRGTYATVRFAGYTDFMAGEWLGLDLDQPEGKNDGAVEGKRYFRCRPNHGRFVRPHKVEVIQRGVPRSPSAPSGLNNASGRNRHNRSGSVASPTSPSSPGSLLAVRGGPLAFSRSEGGVVVDDDERASRRSSPLSIPPSNDLARGSKRANSPPPAPSPSVSESSIEHASSDEGDFLIAADVDVELDGVLAVDSPVGTPTESRRSSADAAGSASTGSVHGRSMRELEAQASAIAIEVTSATPQSARKSVAPSETRGANQNNNNNSSNNSNNNSNSNNASPTSTPSNTTQNNSPSNVSRASISSVISTNESVNENDSPRTQPGTMPVPKRQLEVGPLRERRGSVDSGRAALVRRDSGSRLRQQRRGSLDARVVGGSVGEREGEGGQVATTTTASTEFGRKPLSEMRGNSTSVSDSLLLGTSRDHPTTTTFTATTTTATTTSTTPTTTTCDEGESEQSKPHAKKSLRDALHSLDVSQRPTLRSVVSALDAARVLTSNFEKTRKERLPVVAVNKHTREMQTVAADNTLDRRLTKLRSQGLLNDEYLAALLRPSLVSLDLSTCDELTDLSIRRVTEVCTGLTTLNLTYCEQLTDVSCAAIAEGLPGLAVLSLARCSGVSDAGVSAVIQSCEDLVSLSLAWTDVTDMSVRLLATHVHELYDLDLSGCSSVTESTLTAVVEAHSQTLRSLCLSNCGVSDITASSVGLCLSLEKLALDCCVDVSGEAFAKLTKTLSLRDFVASCTRIDDQGLLNLAKQSRQSLAYLDISDCECVTPAGILSVARKCHELLSLSIANTSATPDAVSLLVQHAKNLKSLDVYGCHHITHDDAVEALVARGVVVTAVFGYGEDDEYVGSEPLLTL